jgi:hypothetical protein
MYIEVTALYEKRINLSMNIDSRHKMTAVSRRIPSIRWTGVRRPVAFVEYFLQKV